MQAERRDFGIGERPALVSRFLEIRPAALVAPEGAVLDVPDLRGEPIDEVAIVADRDDRAVVFTENGFQLLARGEIEVVRRLIEHEEIRLARGKARQREARALAAREHPDRAENLVAAEQEPREEIASVLFVESGRFAKRVDDRRVAGQLGLRLREERDPRRRCARDVPVERRELAHQRAHESGLARAVRTDHRDARPALDAQRWRADDDAIAIAGRERRGLEHRRAREMRGFEAPPVPRARTRRVDPLEPG